MEHDRLRPVHVPSRILESGGGESGGRAFRAPPHLSRSVSVRGERPPFRHSRLLARLREKRARRVQGRSARKARLFPRYALRAGMPGRSRRVRLPHGGLSRPRDGGHGHRAHTAAPCREESLCARRFSRHLPDRRSRVHAHRAAHRQRRAAVRYISSRGRQAGRQADNGYVRARARDSGAGERGGESGQTFRARRRRQSFARGSQGALRKV